MTQASAGAMHWSKPSENRFCERSAKPIGLSEALVERQLAWASRGRHWHTRWISWGSLALHNKSDIAALDIAQTEMVRELVDEDAFLIRDPTPGQAAWSPAEGGRIIAAVKRCP